MFLTIKNWKYQAKYLRMYLIYNKGEINMEPIIKYITPVAIIFIVIYGIDTILFRHLFWERLIANIGIILLSIIIYLNVLEARNQENNI